MSGYVRRLCDDCDVALQPGEPRRCGPCFSRLLVDCAGCGESMVALAGYDFCVACTADIDTARERFSTPSTPVTVRDEGCSADCGTCSLERCSDEAEREACADVSDDLADIYDGRAIRDAIRARGAK